MKRINDVIAERIFTGNHRLRWLKKPSIDLLRSPIAPRSVNAAARMIGCSLGTLEKHFKQEIENLEPSPKRFVDSLVLLQVRELMIGGSSLARAASQLNVSDKTIRRMAVRSWRMTPAQIRSSSTDDVVNIVLEQLGVSPNPPG